MTRIATNAKPGAFARVGLTPAQCEFAKARQRGWNDYRAGRGFRESFDTWKRRKQFAYERGRLQAATAFPFLLSGRDKLSPWQDNETLRPVLIRSVGIERALKVEQETRVARKARLNSKTKGK